MEVAKLLRPYGRPREAGDVLNERSNEAWLLVRSSSGTSVEPKIISASENEPPLEREYCALPNEYLAASLRLVVVVESGALGRSLDLPVVNFAVSTSIGFVSMVDAIEDETIDVSLMLSAPYTLDTVGTVDDGT